MHNYNYIYIYICQSLNGQSRSLYVHTHQPEGLEAVSQLQIGVQIKYTHNCLNYLEQIEGLRAITFKNFLLTIAACIKECIYLCIHVAYVRMCSLCIIASDIRINTCICIYTHLHIIHAIIYNIQTYMSYYGVCI